MSGFPDKIDREIIRNLANHQGNWCSDGICEHFLLLCSVLELRHQGLALEVFALSSVNGQGGKQKIASLGLGEWTQGMGDGNGMPVGTLRSSRPQTDAPAHYLRSLHRGS